MYKGINLIPYMFGNYGTVEFRMHSQSFNKNKVAHWARICVAIVDYAKNFVRDSNYMTDLSKLTLEDIINTVYSSLELRASNLKTIEYIEYRKKYCGKVGANGAKDVEEDSIPNKLHLYA